MGQHLKALGILLLLGLLAFASSLNNPFLVDDHAFFEQKAHFSSNIFAARSDGAYYRPLAVFIPMLWWELFRNNIIAYHTANLLLFCLLGWGIYGFLRYLGASYLLALIPACLFIIHPINGVVVNYITAAVFTVQAMLMLASLYFTLRSSMGLACIFYVLASFCHETAFFLPFYAFIFLFILSDEKDLQQRVRLVWPRVQPLFICLGGILLFRLFCAPLQEIILGKFSSYQMTFFQYLATCSMLLFWYLAKLFWPQGIVLIMAHQPLVEGVTIWLLLLAALAWLVFYFFKAFRQDKPMLLGMAMFLTGFAALPLACLYQPVHGLIIEPHWFLFPVIGFFIVIACLWERLMLKARPLAWGFVIIVGCALFLSTRWYNEVWSDEVRYCTYWLEQAPAFVGINAYLAQAYQLRGEYQLAREHFLRVLPLGVRTDAIYASLGTMDIDSGIFYFEKGEYLKALKYFERAKSVPLPNPVPYLDLAQVYLKLNEPLNAEEVLEEGLRRMPGERTMMENLSQVRLISESH